MKIAIVGSRSLDRNISCLNYIIRNIDAWNIKYNHLEIVSGDCTTGPDYWAKRYALLLEKENNFAKSIKYVGFPADWNKHGKAAGPIRNEEIVKYCDCVLVCWDGKSRGSKTVIDLCEKYDKVIHVRRF